MAPRMMTQERRAAPRVAERITLAVTDDKTTLQTETKNLSASGAYCLLDQFVAPMTKLQLQFELPGGLRRAKIRCSGVVVRVEPLVTEAVHGRYHVAIFFTDLSDRDRASISRFVKRRLADGSAPS